MIRQARNVALGGGCLLLVGYELATSPNLLLDRNLKIILPRTLETLCVFGGLAVIVLALTVSIFLERSTIVKWLAISSLSLGCPILLLVAIGLSLAEGTIGEVNRVVMTNSTVLMLGVEPIPTDVVFSIWKAQDRIGLKWQRIDASLTYSEDGPRVENPALVLTERGQVLIRRGGLWTDCLEASFKSCPGTKSWLDWQKPEDWTEQSKRIQSLTGLVPE